MSACVVPVCEPVCLCVHVCVYLSSSVCIMLQLEALCLSFSPCAVGQPLRTLSLRSRLCLHPSLPFVFTQKNDSLWNSGLLLWSLPHRPWPRAEPYPPSLLGGSGLWGEEKE